MQQLTASDRYALIRQALAAGSPELADAIDNERRCKDCGAWVNDGVTVDPDKCCFYCKPLTDTLDHTDVREKPDKIREPTLWVTDAELIKRSGVPEKAARKALRAMDKNPLSGFPKKNELWGGRRFWPEVVEYWRKMPPPQERRRA